MSTKEFRTAITTDLAFAQNITTNTTTYSSYILDVANYDGGVTFVAFSPIFLGGSFIFFIQESDDSGMAGATIVPEEKLIDGISYGIIKSKEGDEITKLVGVVCTKRYLRLGITSDGAAGDNLMLILAIKTPETIPTI